MSIDAAATRIADTLTVALLREMPLPASDEWIDELVVEIDEAEVERFRRECERDARIPEEDC